MLLKKLTEAHGVSGNEGRVREILREEVSPHVEEIFSDTIGNLYARKGSGKKPRVMLAAHMDEIGLIVIGFDKSGLLKFDKVGGIDDRILVSKPVVVGNDMIPGVIGAKAVHLQKAEERKKAIGVDNLYIDIGVRSQDEAEKRVKLGDYVAFCSTTREIGDKCLLGKAFDDRAGCAVLAETLKNDYDLELFGVFTVQEEVGLRGAGVAAYTVAPDVALVLETTTASDVAGTEEKNHVTRLGKGPAISFMDGTYIAPRSMVKLVIETAEKHGIPYQFRHLTTAGTDAGRISQAHEGVPTIVIAIPCRYIHSPASIIHLDDYHNALRLVHATLNAIAEGGLPR